MAPRAEGRWSDAEIKAALNRAGLDEDTPLTVLAVETLPEPNGSFSDPLGGDLGQVRVIRTSPPSPETVAAAVSGTRLYPATQ